LIFLTLGSHEQQFTRAVEAVLALAESGEELVIQAGATAAPADLAENVRWQQWMSYPDMVETMRAADVVICHAGVGSIMLSLELGKVPVVVARLVEHGEHVDDHQLQIANRMSERGLIVRHEFAGDIATSVQQARNLSRGDVASAGLQLRAAVVEAVDGSGAQHVAVFGPGSGGMGGIERFTSSLLANPPKSFLVAEIDTYGAGGAKMLAKEVLAIASAAGLRGKLPDLAHLNVAHKGSALRKGLIARVLKARGVPYVVHIHGSRFADFERGLPTSLKRRVRAFLNDAERVIVLGESSKAHLVSEVRLEPDLVEIVANGVPGPEFSTPANPASSIVKILYSGRLGDRKGVGELIRAVAKLSDRDDWQLCVAGNGDVAAYAALAQSLGIGERVEFTGWIESNSLQALLQAAEIFTLPSHAEGLPLSVLESMAYSCAIVTTPVGNIADAVEDGVNGLLVNPGEVDSIAQAIAKLLDDPELRASLGGAARTTWEERYSHQQMAAKLGEVWNEALGSVR